MDHPRIMKTEGLYIPVCLHTYDKYTKEIH